MREPLYTFAPNLEQHKARQKLQTLAMLNNGHPVVAQGLSLARIDDISPQLKDLASKSSVVVAHFSERRSRLRLVTLDEGAAQALLETARAEGFGDGELRDVNFELDDVKVGEWDEDERLDVPALSTRIYFMEALNWESPLFNPDPLLAHYFEHREMWESVTAVVYLPQLGLFDPAKAHYSPSTTHPSPPTPLPPPQAHDAAPHSNASPSSRSHTLSGSNDGSRRAEGVGLASRGRGGGEQVGAAGHQVDSMEIEMKDARGGQEKVQGGPSIDTSAVLNVLDAQFKELKVDLQSFLPPPSSVLPHSIPADPTSDISLLFKEQLGDLKAHLDSSIAAITSGATSSTTSNPPGIQRKDKIVVRVDAFHSMYDKDVEGLCKHHGVAGMVEAVSHYNCIPQRFAVVHFRPSERDQAACLVRRINREEDSKRSPMRARFWEYEGADREVVAMMENSKVGVPFEDRFALSDCCYNELGYLPEAARAIGDATTGFAAVFLFRTKFEAEQAVAFLDGLKGKVGAWRLRMRSAEQGLDFSYVNMGRNRAQNQMLQPR